MKIPGAPAWERMGGNALEARGRARREFSMFPKRPADAIIETLHRQGKTATLS